MKPSTSSLVMQPNIVYPEIQHTMVPLNISEHVNNLEPRSLTPSRHDILANVMTINDIPYDDNLPDILEFLQSREKYGPTHTSTIFEIKRTQRSSPFRDFKCVDLNREILSFEIIMPNGSVEE